MITFMIPEPGKKLARLAAILAVALLCAQSLALTHSHDPVDDGICAVCPTSADIAIASLPVAQSPVLDAGIERSALPKVPLASRSLRTHLPRAPPTP